MQLHHNYGNGENNYSNFMSFMQAKNGNYAKRNASEKENARNQEHIYDNSSAEIAADDTRDARSKNYINTNISTGITTDKNIPATNETSTTNLGDPTLNKTSCKEQTSLYFLKVHKAGSTCIQNLFWRFGVSRSLSIMVFKRKFPYPKKDFRPLLLPDPKVQMFDGLYDIFCEHSIFNDKQLKSKMKKDTEYSAILREPLSKLRSALKYFGYVKQHHLGKKMDPAEHFLTSTKSRVFIQTAKEFGFTKHTDIQTFLKDIDSKFKVIAILEHLDESLILMKRNYCWKFKDILYLPLRQTSYATTKDKEKEKELHRLLRERNEIDYLLYEYFVGRHNKQISEERNDFAGEVELFMNISDETKAFCSDVCRQLGDAVSRNASHEQLMEHLSSVVTFPASHWEPAFSVSGLECIMMMFNTGVWRRSQTVTQYPEYCSGGTKHQNFDKKYCEDHFAYSFPWDLLYNAKKSRTFLFKCY